MVGVKVMEVSPFLAVIVRLPAVPDFVSFAVRDLGGPGRVPDS